MKYGTLVLLVCVIGAFGCGYYDDESNGNATTNATTINASTSGNNGGGEITGCCFFNCDGGNGGNWAGPGINDDAACTMYAEGECSSTVAESDYVDGCTGCNTSCAPDGYVSIPD